MLSDSWFILNGRHQCAGWKSSGYGGGDLLTNGLLLSMIG